MDRSQSSSPLPPALLGNRWKKLSMVDSRRVEPSVSSMVLSSTLLMRPLSSVSYCRSIARQNCCRSAGYGMYLARTKSCGLCLSSHLSRFFILSDRPNFVKSGSSASGAEASPAAGGAGPLPPTALSPGFNNPGLGNCAAGSAAESSGAWDGGADEGLFDDEEDRDKVTADVGVTVLESGGRLILLRLCADDVRDMPSLINLGRCWTGTYSGGSRRLYNPVSGSALGDFSMSSLIGRVVDAMKSFPEYLSWSITVRAKEYDCSWPRTWKIIFSLKTGLRLWRMVLVR